MYSACQQQCPVYIIVTYGSVRRQYPVTHARPTLVVPRTRTKLGQHAFSVSGLVAWNALPAIILVTQNYLHAVKVPFYNHFFDITGSWLY